MAAYQAMTIAQLGAFQSGADDPHRWRLVAEFLEEHRHEPPHRRFELLQAEPAETGDQRWDVFLGALAEHLAYKLDRRGPAWCESRILRQFWFPFNTPAARAEAIVWSPAAFRRRGIFVPRNELEVA